MARPLKKGLAYFPLDTDFYSDRKIQRLLLQFGSEGLAVFITVLCEIYRSQGYYLHLYPEFYFDVGFSLHLPEIQVKEIIRYSVKIRLLDDKSLKDKGVLTSKGIQQRYIEVCKRHKNQIDTTYFTEKDRLIPSEETGVSSEKTPVSSETTRVSSVKTPTKGKGNNKEREKENKEEKNKSKKKNYGKVECKEANDDSSRQRELIRMAWEATTGSGTDA